MSAPMERQEFLSYKLLLQKVSDAPLAAAAADKAEAGAGDDAASTAEPPSSSGASSEGGEAAPRRRAPPSRHEVQLLRSVAVHGPHSDERLAMLVRCARDLSEQAFQEDCLQDITKKSRWKLSLLVSADLEVLCGFVVAKVVNGTLSIAKIAVPMEFRGHGLGKLIMEQLIAAAKKQGDVYNVNLSSLPTAVTFYQRLGFKAFKGVNFGSEEDLVPGQVYMVKKLPHRRK